jgi:UDP-N-acetylglucosamine--N-acetylmuramyl-(pentapeptide) pyrophosphoryl-undecaprenol N-acetylglucosamine transferase
MRVLLAGGGSGGSATPILAVAGQVKARHPDVKLLYIGTIGGLEGELAAVEGIRYFGVASGKLRRYWDTQNFSDAFRVMKGIAQALRYVRWFKPDVAFGAGGFASVPPLAAAGLCRVPVLIHQQDVIPGLANKLLVPFARRITVAMPDTVRAFPAGRTTLRGNPVRRSVVEANPAHGFGFFGFDPSVPLVLVTGGGTGALGLNRIVAEAAPALVEKCQIVHLTGRGRGVDAGDLGPRYRQIELLVEAMPHVLAASTVVISRAGMGTLSELAALRKPAVVVPMPGTHQEANARAFDRAGAAIVKDQRTLTADTLVATVSELLASPARRQQLGEAMRQTMPADADERIADDVLALGRAGA